MLESLVNRPNHVIQRQRMYQSDTRPVYQRGPRSGIYLKVYMAFFTFGILGVSAGMFNAFRGKKHEPK